MLLESHAQLRSADTDVLRQENKFVNTALVTSPASRAFLW